MFVSGYTFVVNIDFEYFLLQEHARPLLILYIFLLFKIDLQDKPFIQHIIYIRHI